VPVVRFTPVGKHNDTEGSWGLRRTVLRSPKYAKLSGRYSELLCVVTKQNTERNSLNKRAECVTVCKEGE